MTSPRYHLHGTAVIDSRNGEVLAECPHASAASHVAQALNNEASHFLMRLDLDEMRDRAVRAEARQR